MTEASFRNQWSGWMESEEAQATTEYVLMLAVALMLFLLIVRGFVRPWIAKLTAFLEKQIGDDFFKPGAFHRMPFQGR